MENTCQHEAYTASSFGIPSYPVSRDREEHSRKLQRQLENAFKTDKIRSAHAIIKRNGTYIEFKGLQNGELPTKSLENQTQDVRLLNIRQHDRTTYATVYIPAGKENFFLSRIKTYGDITQATKKGHPKYELLVTSIEDIRLAIVDSLWTGRPEKRPSDKRQWIEVWLRIPKGKKEKIFKTCIGDKRESLFKTYIEVLDKLDIRYKNDHLVFPERMVTLIYANKSDLAKLLDSYDMLAEMREVSDATSSLTNLKPNDQREWIDDLLKRTTFEPGDTSICILDTGVSARNPLLDPIVDKNVILTNDPSIGFQDRDNHGTKVAGIAAYDDLKEKLVSSDPVIVTHAIESVKMLDLSYPNNPRLYGEIEQQSISRPYVVMPNRKRIFCSAVTAREDEITDGLPTSWSAALDESISHANGNTDDRELFLVSGGNISLEMLNGATYPDANDSRGIRSPGQSWNAVTVGAYSEDVQIEEEDIVASGYKPVAMPGELCPFSTTSLSWNQKITPVKPEIVCPGGNALEKDNIYSDCQDLSLLTTGANVASQPLDTINATSAAVGKAAYITAEIANAYPKLWPETVRALLVHSARWSKAMISRYCPEGSDKDKKGKGRHQLLRTCGYGIPNLQRAIECKENSVNLVIQGTIKPYKLDKKGKDTMNEMHVHRLPWPKEVLRSLENAKAILHVTLSYYIEPGPGEIGWKDRYRYASHGLRFDVNKPGETIKDFEHRVNVYVRNKDEGTSISDSGNWFLGVKNRNVGSIHSDYKCTTAIELSDIDYVAVYPVIGWWRSRKYLDRIDSVARYALIVSIETPSVDSDLYTAITEKITNSASAQVAVSVNSMP